MLVYRTDRFIQFLASLSDNLIKLYKKVYQKIQNNNKNISRVFPFLFFIISLISALAVIKKTDRNLRIKEYLASQITIPKKDFIAEHYQVPSLHDVTFDKKKNLVIILVESLENSFSDPRIGPSLTPHLDSLKKQSAYHPNQVQIAGTSWTIAAMTAWHFGLPLKLIIDGNAYRSKFGHTTFLPHAHSIFDILADNGYEQVLIMGSKSRFGGTDNLHKHGKFKIKDAPYWKKTGHNSDAFHGAWEFNDTFVLSQAEKEYQRLSKQDKPFVLIIQTIDTHAPEGFCPEDKKFHHDIRDAILNTDKELGNFLKKNFTTKPENTVVAVLGDHLFMGNPAFLAPVQERTIFNAFYGNIPPISEKKKAEKISSLDIAPTLLEAAGAKWGSPYFGLGVSVFSDVPSLVSIYGIHELNHKLEQLSLLYQSFF
ncbi:MAG: sulfatase-like hydrolase/transferase [Alistipes senegalensis]|nr:sulfatase-like hydrolase/transferase [Oxalobacter formigenes]MCM1281070.1 sulfatase-like hydrolase/transferase [Alistipes senegalensis]